jgi:hypothetical protein
MIDGGEPTLSKEYPRPKDVEVAREVWQRCVDEQNG